MNYNLNRFMSSLSELRITLSDEQIRQFLLYYEMLVEKNKVMNLTAITEFDDVIEKHFLDSLSLAGSFDLSQDISVLDIGTGAGFPGIPLKIAFPNLHMTLGDSLNKRVLFLNEVIRELHLEDVSAIHGRAEDLAVDTQYREHFDLVVSRAVANLSTLSEYCLPFVKKGGNFISYKSGDCDQEVEEAKKAFRVLGGRLSSVKKFSLGEAGRAFVIIDKTGVTPKQYPRKAGTPSKSPLK